MRARGATRLPLAARRPYGAGAAALTLPLGQAPEVAPDPAGVDLAAWEVHVRVADQAFLVPGECHPLGEHVVGVGGTRLRDGAGEVRELDAVLAEEPSGFRNVRNDRLVRIDQVRIRRIVGAGS